jgi:hypothetical protein
MAEGPKLICVRTCQGLDLAQIYKSKLEALGIPVLLKYESAGLVYGITVDGLGAVHVMVPEPQAAEAEALLADLTDDELAEDSPDKKPPHDLAADEIAEERSAEEILPDDSVNL